MYRRSGKMYSAVCADCGKECEVPFKPRQDRPVYCRECWAKRGRKRETRGVPGKAGEKETSRVKKAKEAPLLMLTPILTLGFLSVLIGVHPAPFQTFAEAAISSLLSRWNL